MNGADLPSASLCGFPLQITGDAASKQRVIRLCGAHDSPLPVEPGDCCLISLSVDRWNERFSPWPAPPLRGNEPFTGSGQDRQDTLAFLTKTLLPHLDATLGPGTQYLLAGYSLAGLFALWAGYDCPDFAGVAAVSPSLWFPGWAEYAAGRRVQTRAVYLSLGDREEKVRHPLLSTVGDAVRAQHRLLERDGVPAVLEWNPGNHFRDSEIRTAKGIAWLLRQLA